MSQTIRFQTFEIYHGKRGVGSTNLRVHQLIKHWPEADLYKYGEQADVLIFQKVYVTQDYVFPIHYKEGLKILDICDPDWLEGVLIKQTIDAMDAVTCPTEPIQKFLKQLTDKPIVVIPDRYDISLVPKPKLHKGKAKKLVWFGYAHNAVTLKPHIRSLEKMGFELTIISNEDPRLERYADSEETVNYVKHPTDGEMYMELQKYDVCIMPKGSRPQDKYKSNNKTIRANLAGLPVAHDLDSLEAVIDGDARQKVAAEAYQHAVNEYNCKTSVMQYKDLIDELTDAKA